jgi:hypothetical protein
MVLGALKIDEKKEIARYESALEDDGSSSSEDTGKDDSPWEVSSDSELEQSPTRKLSQKHLLRTNLTPQPPTSGLMTTAPLEYIKYVVDCLWRLPIRRPAPLDRMKRKTSADTSPYLPFDLMHVKEKFPNVEEIVAARLAKMISRRRQIIRYRKEHTETMQEKVSTSNVPAVHPIMQSYSRKGGEASEAAASFKTPSQRTENTKATTLRPGAPVATLMPQSGIYAPSVSESRSSTTSEQTAEDIPIKVPKRPKKKEGKALDHFICPYCSTAQFITSERKWK